VVAASVAVGFVKIAIGLAASSGRINDFHIVSAPGVRGMATRPDRIRLNAPFLQLAVVSNIGIDYSELRKGKKRWTS
jgi:hypothetical protein